MKNYCFLKISEILSKFLKKNVGIALFMCLDSPEVKPNQAEPPLKMYQILTTLIDQ